MNGTSSETISYGITKLGGENFLRVGAYPEGINETEWWNVQRNTSIEGLDLLDGDWHHVAYVVDLDSGPNGTLSSYLDGQFYASESLPSSWTDLRQNDHDLVVGGQLNFSPRNFSGSIDEIEIKNSFQDAIDFDFSNLRINFISTKFNGSLEISSTLSFLRFFFIL